MTEQEKSEDANESPAVLREDSSADLGQDRKPPRRAKDRLPTVVLGCLTVAVR